MRQVRTCASLCSLVCCFPLTLGVLGLLAACVSAPDHQDWIRVDVTTGCFCQGPGVVSLPEDRDEPSP